MDEEKRKKEERKDTGLTTATLAGAGKPKEHSEISAARAETANTTEEQVMPLFSTDEAKDFRARWDSIQAGFVDEPRRAVEQADGLVAEAMKRMAEIFADERGKLERQWDRGNSSPTATEDLRLALRRYRSFFGRILSV